MNPADYHERLLPRWWACLAAVVPVAMLAVAYGAALGVSVGLLVGVGGLAIAVWLLWISAPVIAVTDHGIRAAGARLPLSSVGDAQIVDRTQIQALRGPAADARLFAVLRPWSASSGVLVNLDDAEDPHPAWLLSTRHPDLLLRSLATWRSVA